MTESSEFEVSFSLTLARTVIGRKQFRTYVKQLMMQHGCDAAKGARCGEKSYDVKGVFHDRGDAIASAIAIRTLALKHAPHEIESFHFMLGNLVWLKFGRRKDGSDYKIIDINEIVAPAAKLFHENEARSKMGIAF